MDWQTEQQMLDEEMHQQELEAFVERVSAKLSPADAAYLARELTPWVKPEPNPSGRLFTEMACARENPF